MGSKKVLENFSWRSWKVLEKSRIILSVKEWEPCGTARSRTRDLWVTDATPQPLQCQATQMMSAWQRCTPGQGSANRPFAFELNLESNWALRFEFESNVWIESVQVQWILITKIINYKRDKWDVWNYIFLIAILKHIKLPAYDHS